MTAVSSHATGGATGKNLIANPSFDKGLEGWSTNSRDATFEAAEEDGRTVGRITVSDDDPVAYPFFFQDFPVTAGAVYELRLDAKGHNIRDGIGNVYAVAEFLGTDGERVGLSGGAHVTGQDEWHALSSQALGFEEAKTMRISLILNARGEAFFDNVELIQKSAPAPEAPFEGSVALTVTDHVVCDSLMGMGGEDDGWFFNKTNRYHDGGNEVRITPEEYAMNIARLEWLDPDYVRMFVWAKDWCPSGDWETFTWDTDNMQSRYKTLELYQRLGTTVDVTGVEWHMDPKMYTENPEGLAHGFGELLEHLIREKGFTCVKQWTLTNEPNGAFTSMGGTFDFFVKIHQLMRKEIQRRGLDVAIVGSDDAQDISWFRRCVESDDYFEAVDLFCSHRYFRVEQRPLIPLYYDNRFEALAKRSERKPMMIGEFGFQDERSEVIKNPIMVEYRYAPWTAAFVIDGLNRGIAAFNIWTLHDMRYSGGGLMTYGLWAFDQDDWAIRPVYHAMGMFMRLTEAGDAVRRCESSHDSRVKAAVVGDTLFWVNLGKEPARVAVSGFDGHEVRVMEEKTLEGDRECGVVLKIDGKPRFTAPPQSFGYVR